MLAGVLRYLMRPRGGGTSLARLIPLQLYEAAAGALLSQILVRKGEGKDDAEALS